MTPSLRRKASHTSCDAVSMEKHVGWSQYPAEQQMDRGCNVYETQEQCLVSHQLTGVASLSHMCKVMAA